MLNIPEVSISSIEYAFNRLADFNQVNQGRKDRKDRIKALKLYCNSVGIDNDETISHLFDQCEVSFGEPQASNVFVGVLLGLAMMEYRLDQ